ncbi:MAG: beta-N-acetylhexosaminidase [Alphaproteobacteria bacterium]|nr:beta-N-acetylhexosaminidase [Alphaproteobacteria bacterium]
MTIPLAVIFAVSGTELTLEERRFLRDANPLGFILFGRNCEEPAAIRKLTSDLRECVGRKDAPILIDQEGGTVMRLRPPIWVEGPSAQTLGTLFLREPQRAMKAAHSLGAMFGAQLRDLGINVDCAPVADLGLPETTEAIGSRAYSKKPDVIVALARKMSDGLMQEGCLPVVKHMPGHGRGQVDSHQVLPRVETDIETLQRSDFAIFRSLNDLPLAMSAHIVFDAVDPDSPATVSQKVINEVIRGDIGFDGFLMSDDIAMSALEGNPAQRAQDVLNAGCDAVLHCTGDLSEMVDVATVAMPLSDKAQTRWGRALAMRPHPAGNAPKNYADQLTQALRG